MTLQDRDRRALLILGAALIVGAVLYFTSGSLSTGGGAKVLH